MGYVQQPPGPDVVRLRLQELREDRDRALGALGVRLRHRGVEGQHAYEGSLRAEAVVELAHLQVDDAQLLQQLAPVYPPYVAPRIGLQGLFQDVDGLVGFSEAEVVAGHGHVRADHPRVAHGGGVLQLLPQLRALAGAVVRVVAGGQGGAQRLKVLGLRGV